MTAESTIQQLSSTANLSSAFAFIQGKQKYQVNYSVQVFSGYAQSESVMSTGRAKPGSRPGTDQLFPVSDRVTVTILLK